MYARRESNSLYSLRMATDPSGDERKSEVRETPTGTVWELVRLAVATYLLCFSNHVPAAGFEPAQHEGKGFTAPGDHQLYWHDPLTGIV